MSDTPLVSVIVPAWNAAAFIEEALQSLRAQTLVDWEAIVVDDASSDLTRELVAAVAAVEPRIKLLGQPVNGGPSAARNRGLAEARGRYVALLDADDSYEPTRLVDLVGLAERRGADMVSDNLWLIPEDNPAGAAPMIPEAVLAGDRELTLTEFIQRNVADPKYPGLNLGFLKPIFRQDFLERNSLAYDERVRFAEDFGLYLACFRAGARWWMSSSTTYRYRVRGGSLTQIQTVHDLGVLSARLSALIEQARATGDRTLARSTRRQARVVDRCYHYRAFTDHLKARHMRAAWGELSLSLRAATLIAEEAGRQLPVIARKAARGGYRVPTIHTFVTEPPAS